MTRSQVAAFSLVFAVIALLALGIGYKFLVLNSSSEREGIGFIMLVISGVAIFLSLLLSELALIKVNDRPKKAIIGVELCIITTLLWALWGVISGPPISSYLFLFIPPAILLSILGVVLALSRSRRK